MANILICADCGEPIFEEDYPEPCELGEREFSPFHRVCRGGRRLIRCRTSNASVFIRPAFPDPDEPQVPVTVWGAVMRTVEVVQ